MPTAPRIWLERARESPSALLTTGKLALIPFDLPKMRAASRAYDTRKKGMPTCIHAGGQQHTHFADIFDMMGSQSWWWAMDSTGIGERIPWWNNSMLKCSLGIQAAILYRWACEPRCIVSRLVR